MKRLAGLLIHVYPLQWQVWPVWARHDPDHVFIGPVVVTIRWDWIA